MIKIIETFALNLNVSNISFIFFVFDKVFLLNFKSLYCLLILFFRLFVITRF